MPNFFLHLVSHSLIFASRVVGAVSREGMSEEKAKLPPAQSDEPQRFSISIDDDYDYFEDGPPILEGLKIVDLPRDMPDAREAKRPREASVAMDSRRHEEPNPKRKNRYITLIVHLYIKNLLDNRGLTGRHYFRIRKRDKAELFTLAGCQTRRSTQTCTVTSSTRSRAPPLKGFA